MIIQDDDDRCGTCLGCDLPLGKECKVCLYDKRPGKVTQLSLFTEEEILKCNGVYISSVVEAR